MGTPEIVVKRARPCSSRFMPLGAPIGLSGFFSNAGSSVFSAHCVSEAEGWRFSVTSAIGVSETSESVEECFLSAIWLLSRFDHRRGAAAEQVAGDHSVGYFFWSRPISQAFAYFQETYPAWYMWSKSPS